jgi:hypothetical protein
MTDIVTERAAASARFADWLSKGWLIGIFENHDLDSRDVGVRFALPFGPEFADAKIGEARAPDTKAYGLGWRYILTAKPETVEQAIELIFKEAA